MLLMYKYSIRTFWHFVQTSPWYEYSFNSICRCSERYLREGSCDPSILIAGEAILEVASLFRSGGSDAYAMRSTEEHIHPPVVPLLLLHSWRWKTQAEGMLKS